MLTYEMVQKFSVCLFRMQSFFEFWEAVTLNMCRHFGISPLCNVSTFIFEMKFRKCLAKCSLLNRYLCHFHIKYKTAQRQYVGISFRKHQRMIIRFANLLPERLRCAPNQTICIPGFCIGLLGVGKYTSSHSIIYGQNKHLFDVGAKDNN